MLVVAGNGWWCSMEPWFVETLFVLHCDHDDHVVVAPVDAVGISGHSLIEDE